MYIHTLTVMFTIIRICLAHCSINVSRSNDSSALLFPPLCRMRVPHACAAAAAAAHIAININNDNNQQRQLDIDATAASLDVGCRSLFFERHIFRL